MSFLAEYYSKAQLSLPSFPQWRFWRMHTQFKFFAIKRTIRHANALRSLILKHMPLDVYHSVNLWLSPSTVSYNEFKNKKAGYEWAQNIMIGDGALVFDIDAHSRTLDEAHMDACALDDALNEKGYMPQWVFTGNGFRCAVEKHDLRLENKLPLARIIQYKQLREPLVKEFLQLGISLDCDVTLDAKRVIRIIGTVNSKSGHVCTIVNSLENFSLEDVERLRLANFIPVSPQLEGMGCDIVSPVENEAGDSIWVKSGRTRKATLSQTHPTIPTIYLGTFIIGTLDRQIILLRFPQPVNIDELKERLSRFAESEQLAPFLIFKARKVPDTIWALSPTAIQFDGMKRLLKRFPEARGAYAKFRRRIVPFPIEPLAQTSGVTDTEKPISRAHYRYLSHYHLADYSPKILCGNSILSTPVGEMNL